MGICASSSFLNFIKSGLGIVLDIVFDISIEKQTKKSKIIVRRHKFMKNDLSGVFYSLINLNQRLTKYFTKIYRLKLFINKRLKQLNIYNA